MRDRLTSRTPLTEFEAMNLSLTNLYMRLKTYEDAEEEGRLIVLPCKVGDTVWGITYDCDADDDICAFPTGMCRNCNIGKRVIGPRKVTSLNMAVFYYEKLGETVFLTREDAEAALGGGNDEP